MGIWGWRRERRMKMYELQVGRVDFIFRNQTEIVIWTQLMASIPANA